MIQAAAGAGDGLSAWATRCELAARATLGGEVDRPAGPLDLFRDEAGNRRDVDRPLLGWVWRAAPGSPPPGARGDVALWWNLHAGQFDDRVLVPGRSTPLVAHGHRTGIEVWTETELSALHALWHVARKFGRADLQDRAIRAAEWHVGNLQPDNATHRAWGVHVFVVLAVRARSSEADLFAQTLLHNCTIGLGRPDVLSAWLLLDSARALRQELGD